MNEAEAATQLQQNMDHVKDPLKRNGNLACEKNAEEWVSDGGGDMPVYKIGKCILHEECHSKSRSCHDMWSLDSPERCLGYLKHHLKWSSKHPDIETEDQAQQLIDSAMDPDAEEVPHIDWQSHVASSEDFAKYKMQCAKTNQKKQEIREAENQVLKKQKAAQNEREAEIPPPPPPAKRSRLAQPDDPGLAMAVRTEVAMAVRTEMAMAMRDSGGSAPSHSAGSRECIVKILGNASDTHEAAAIVVQEGFYALPISTFKSMMSAVKELEAQMVEDIAYHTDAANAAVDKKHKLASMRNNLEMVEEIAIRNSNPKGKGKGKGKHR